MHSFSLMRALKPTNTFKTYLDEVQIINSPGKLSSTLEEMNSESTWLTLEPAAAKNTVY